MHDLQLVGFTTDRRGLILRPRAGARSDASFVVPVTAELVALVAQIADEQAVDPVELEPVVDPAEEAAAARPRSQMSVRDIQARLRAGEPVAQVAAEAGVDDDWIERFAPPIRAEQRRIVDRALEQHLHRARAAPSAFPLRRAVGMALAEKGIAYTVAAFEAAWSAHLLGHDRWTVAFTYRHRGQDRTATWTYDAAADELTTADRTAAQLGYVAPGKASAAANEYGEAIDGIVGDPEATTQVGTVNADRTSRRRPAAATSGARPPRKKQSPRPATSPAKGASPKRAGGQAVTKRAAAKKAAAKKAASQRAATKQTAAKKTAARRAAAKKATAKKAAAEKATAKKVAAKKAAAEKKVKAAERAAARKAAAQQASATKKAAAAEKAAAAKTATAAKAAAKKQAAKVAAEKRAAAQKAAAKQTAARKKAAAEQAAARKKVTAEKATERKRAVAEKAATKKAAAKKAAAKKSAPPAKAATKRAAPAGNAVPSQRAAATQPPVTTSGAPAKKAASRVQAPSGAAVDTSATGTPATGPAASTRSAGTSSAQAAGARFAPRQGTPPAPETRAGRDDPTDGRGRSADHRLPDEPPRPGPTTRPQRPVPSPARPIAGRPGEVAIGDVPLASRPPATNGRPPGGDRPGSPLDDPEIRRAAQADPGVARRVLAAERSAPTVQFRTGSAAPVRSAAEAASDGARRPQDSERAAPGPASSNGAGDAATGRRRQLRAR